MTSLSAQAAALLNSRSAVCTMIWPKAADWAFASCKLDLGCLSTALMRAIGMVYCRECMSSKASDQQGRGDPMPGNLGDISGL